MAPRLTTARLLLRPWREEDLDPFAALNADPVVMEHFPRVLNRQETEAVIRRFQAHFQAHGFGGWAVEVPGVAPLIGFVGLNVPTFQAPFLPCVEVGWRLARGHWGHGYATEAARAALDFGFGKKGLEEIVSFTTVGNTRSRAVMERLGMKRDPAEDFDHPNLPEGSPLRRHVLYRLSTADWRARVW